MTTRTATKAPAKRPDDQPFDFNLDAVECEVDLTPWRVHWSGRRWEFAHMENLDVWGLMEAAEGGDIAATIGIFKAALGDKDWQDFRKVRLPQYKLKALFDAYREHCGVAEGESPASSDS
ncbi:hypothetical protein PV728_29565 [Streptomyces europaeiscabiei]|uniref:hypothetical protein n=1 Tax=Streptomyces europaeiscabiei TaxID=146819 RepID=UPI0029B9EF41|nr:hypothetical protein [Streptomyces europaeiscabiei]MDX3634340.1 hypothetical protein [Streptomyces europaeiscabiei]MDX3651812.1 hypothetical protein [Streptomyces europaeiscabiei]